MRFFRLQLLVLAIACMGLSAQRAQGSIFAISGISTTTGQAISAEASFSVTGDIATVVLTNTSLSDVLVQSDILTAVFFDVAGDQVMTSQSAVLTTGSVVHFGSTDPGNVVGGEWGYGTGLSGAPRGISQGISSSGFGLFGGATFPGTNLMGPAALNGVEYGITSAGDDMGTGQPAVTGGSNLDTNHPHPVALIQKSVTFTFSGATGLTGDDFSNVGFQYGTTLADSFLFSVPEPGSLMIWSLLGIAGVCFRRNRV